MNKIKNALVAISILFAFTAANAGELTVSGNMETTYNSQGGSVTGNPLGMDRELKFSGSTELDNGMTVTVMQDTSDNLGYGNSQISFGNISIPYVGATTIYVGSDHDPIDSVDDVTPSAYEEANGSGSGTYKDIGSLAGQMGIGAKLALPYGVNVNTKYYKKPDGVKNSDNANSADASSNVKAATSTVVTMDLGAIDAAAENLKLTLGYAEADRNAENVSASTDMDEMTAAFNYAYGPVKAGIQKKVNSIGADSGSLVRHHTTILGLAFAVNDQLSISVNRYTDKKQSSLTAQAEQETDAINIGYTMGGMTIGFQEASTDNAGYVRAAEDDSRTLGVSVAF